MQRNTEKDVSTATQTEDEDGGDPLILNCLNGDQSATGFYPGFGDLEERGFMSNLMAMVLPGNSFITDHFGRHDRRSVLTQTEELDPITAKGHQLSYLVIQDLALENDLIPSWAKDDVYGSLCSGVCELLDKHSILFNGIMNRINIASFRAFESISNELFDANNANGGQDAELRSTHPRLTWGRLVSLFAFAVRAVQEYREEQDRVDEITRYLASYVSSHVVPFVRMNGGWAGLVETFPAPVDEEAQQVKRAIMLSGLCMGLLATMYVSSLLR